jgi:hypothetical protein
VLDARADLSVLHASLFFEFFPADFYLFYFHAASLRCQDVLDLVVDVGRSLISLSNLPQQDLDLFDIHIWTILSISFAIFHNAP